MRLTLSILATLWIVLQSSGAMAQPAPASISPRKMRIAIINSEEKAEERYREISQQIIGSFRRLEPFRSRFSQLEFFVLWNKTDLHCGPLRVGSYVDHNRRECDYSVLRTTINKETGSFDFAFVVLTDGSNFVAVPSNPFVFIDLQKEAMYNAGFHGMSLHEFGHAFAGLDDEYTYYEGTLQALPYLRSISKSSSWESCFATREEALRQPFVGIRDVAPGCTRPDLWRTKALSLMESPKYDWFSSLQQQKLSKALDKIVGPLVDTEKPKIRFMDPPEYSLFGGTEGRWHQSISIVPQVSDNIGISGVQILVDGEPWLTSTRAPEFSFQLIGEDIPEGRHTYQLRAFDHGGNEALSEVREYDYDPRPAAVRWDRSSSAEGEMVGVYPVAGTAKVKVVHLFIDGQNAGSATPPTYGLYRFIPNGKKAYALVEYEDLDIKTKVQFKRP